MLPQFFRADPAAKPNLSFGFSPGIPAPQARPAPMAPAAARPAPAAPVNYGPFSADPNIRRQQVTNKFRESGLETQRIWDTQNPFKIVAGANYLRPARGTIGPGGAGLDSGLGRTNNNPASYGTPYAGLWARGYDTNDPNAAYNLYDSLMKNSMFRPGTPFYSLKGRSDPNALFAAADNYYSGQAKAMDRNNSFMNSVPGQLLGLALTAGAGAVAGPIGAGIVGATTGGASGGVKGALLGGAGGYLGTRFANYIPKPVQRAGTVFSVGNALTPKTRG